MLFQIIMKKKYFNKNWPNTWCHSRSFSFDANLSSAILVRYSGNFKWDDVKSSDWSMLWSSSECWQSH
jgi:hypothetical protein